MAAPNFKDKTIWTGDNLHILRGLNSETVDLIYLDPPFNSNRSYAAPIGSQAAGAAFKDTWTLSDLDVALMGLIADEHPSIADLLAIAGKVHGKGMQSYLTMMAVRLLEMRRILKPTGSIYLHCDLTASHYLKLLMDAVFGTAKFRSDISWVRQAGGKNDAVKAPGRVQDRLLFYGETYYVDNVRRPLTDAQRAAYSIEHETFGASRPGNLLAPKTSTGEPGIPWRGFDPNKKGRMWSPPRTGALAAWIEENVIPGYRDLGTHARLDALDAAGLIHWPTRDIKGGWPTVVHPLAASIGTPLSDLWDDVGVLARGSKERVGYPTQKPLALLERIIAASSNPGDFVLDPFCGCATACVAAEKLGRRWMGIDLSPKAAELVNTRLKAYMGDLFHNRLVIPRTDVPQRTDIEAPKNYRENKHVLYGQQEGQCAACGMDFPFKIFEVDHIVPQSLGGTDHIENLQLLCPHCNRLKGARPQEYLLAELRKQGAIA